MTLRRFATARIAVLLGAAWAVSSLPGRTAHATPVSSVGTVDIQLNTVLNTLRPDRAFGAGVDGHQQGDIRLIYTPANVRAMRSSGYGSLSYRLRSELAVEAWHWNPVGTWSDPTHQQGYWTGSSHLPARGTAPSVTYGYRLPRRGNTIDQANDDGYSRLDDGRLSTFWKSNPYLDPHFTHQPDTAHPQWLLVDLGRKRPVDAVRLAWAAPYARRMTVQFFTGPDALAPANDPGRPWLPFPRADFTGSGGTQTLRFSAGPEKVRFIRILMYGSSHTSLRPSRDIRDRLGFAVREVWVGTLQRGRLVDLLRHRPRNDQTVTFVSSTDPWHTARDLDRQTEQPSFQTVLRSGLANHSPMLTPVPTLYGTPDDAAAELRYLRALHAPVTRMELGEEPDGQLVTPEDYGALYAEFARRLHHAEPRLQLGGPGYQTSIPDWVHWPLKPGGDISWTRRFLQELHRDGQSSALGFFSLEWYPFDNGCLPSGPDLVRNPGLLAAALAAQRREGVPPSVPILITEYGYSAFSTRHMVELAGALLNADIVGQFLASGGQTAYLYGLEPDALIDELPCHSWGNLILFLSDDAHRIRQPVAALWTSRMMTQDWVLPGRGAHKLLASSTTALDTLRRPLVSSYVVRRPDGKLGLMLVNKDPARTWDLRVRLHKGAETTSPAGRLTVISFSSSQYEWHARGARGFARPDRPPSRTSQPAQDPVRLPPSSLTVVQLRP